MNALTRRIARLIRTDGPLSLAAFMTIVLHDREEGFYSTRDSIGARGAFITAPEVTQMFGELLGLWCAETWRGQGAPKVTQLVELGPGRGVLMHDTLRALRAVPEFLSAIEVTLVEASPVLEQVQRKNLLESPAKIRWVRQWSDVSQNRPLFVLGNEFLDALPLRQFVKTERGWCERMIATDSAGDLIFALAPEPAPLHLPEGLGPAEPGAVYEISFAAEALVEDVARSIAENGGAALFIDYGHAGHRFGDTLQAVTAHQRTGVFDAPGEADVSAHVDFAALARVATKSGARVHGPIAQGKFLGTLGIDQRAQRLSVDNPEYANVIAAAAHRLTGPDQMGTLFKVMAIAPPGAPPPPGFDLC